MITNKHSFPIDTITAVFNEFPYFVWEFEAGTDLHEKTDESMS